MNKSRQRKGCAMKINIIITQALLYSKTLSFGCVKINQKRKRVFHCHLNAHTHFEGIGLSETAMSIPLSSANVSSQDITDYYGAHINFHKVMRVAFPNTITVLSDLKAKNDPCFKLHLACSTKYMPCITN